LEDEFWQGLREIAKKEGTSTAELVGQISREKHTGNLSSAIRVFVLKRFRASADTPKPSSPEMPRTKNR